MRSPLLLSLALAFATALATSAAHADHCAVEDADPEVDTPATGVSLAAKEVGGEDPGIYYVDTTVCQPECLFDLWIYEETNGWPGLQRGDEFGDDCQYLQPDTIVL